MRPGRYRATRDVTIRLMRWTGETPEIVRVIHAKKGEEITLGATFGGHYWAGGVTVECRESLRALDIHADVSLERID